MFFVVGDRIPKIKFTYFNGRGLGELSRLILAQAGVEFEDQRLTPDEWKKLKSTTPPPHQVPLLDFDGFKISQSITIARFLAKTYSLDGKSILEKAQADMIVDFMVEIKIKCRNNPNFKTEILPEAMKMFEKFLESNDNKYFVGNELTWADIAVASLFDDLKIKTGEEIFGEHKSLKNHFNYVMKLPNIKKWVEKRPLTAL